MRARNRPSNIPDVLAAHLMKLTKLTRRNFRTYANGSLMFLTLIMTALKVSTVAAKFQFLAD